MTLFEAFILANRRAELNCPSALYIDAALKTAENRYMDGYVESDTWKMLLRSLEHSVGIYHRDYKAVAEEFENRQRNPYPTALHPNQSV